MTNPLLIATSPHEQTVKNLLSPNGSSHVPETQHDQDDNWDDQGSVTTLQSFGSSTTTLAGTEDSQTSESQAAEKKHASATVTEITEKPINHRQLIAFDELPLWHRDNPRITGSYRPINFSWRECLKSLLHVHNETVNVYSHLVPGIVFLLLQIVFGVWVIRRYPDATAGDNLALAAFMLSASVCLCASASYHALMCHSEKVNNFWLGMDFIGIIVLTEGMFVSGIWMIFRCDKTERIIYWTACLSLGIVSILLLLNPRLQGLRFRNFRITIFIVTGAAGLAPVIHGFVKFKGTELINLGAFLYLTEGLMLLAGVMFYGTRWPESLPWFKKGRFDVWGSSHQIFHVFVVGAVIVHLFALLKGLEYNMTARKCMMAQG